MNDTKEILDRIDAMAAKLGVAAQDMLAILVDERIRLGWCGIAAGTIFLVAVLVAGRRACKAANEDDRAPWVMLAVAALLISFILLGVGVQNVLAPTTGVLEGLR